MSIASKEMTGGRRGYFRRSGMEKKGIARKNGLG